MLLLFLFSFFSLMLCSNLYAGYAAANHNAPVYDNFASTNAAARLDIGAPVDIIIRRGARAQFDYMGHVYWIDLKDIAEIDFDMDSFTDEAAEFAELPPVQDRYIRFVYKNKAYILDTEGGGKAQVFAEVPDFTQISVSEDGSKMLLTGNKDNFNVALYDGDFTPLTFFDKNKATIESADFSQDGKYLALYFSAGNSDILHIYDTSSKKLVLARRGVAGFSWIDSKLFVSAENNIVYYIEPARPKNIYSFSKKNTESLQFAEIGGEYYFRIDGDIYLFTGSELQKSSVKTLDSSPNGSIEHYTRGNQFFTDYKGARIRQLSGASPQWTFISILDDSNILYRQRKDILQVLELYNAETKQSYSYYWAENPYYVFKNGVVAEYINEDEQIWLLLEKPDDFVKLNKIEDII